MSLKMSVPGLMALGVLLALGACNGDGGDSAATPTAEPMSTVEPPPELCPRIDDKVVQALIALLEPDRLSYQQGEPIEMTLRLVNCASKPITGTFPDAQRYEFSAGIQQEAKEDGTGPVPVGAGDCDDSTDNDGDTLTDSADPECASPPAAEVWRWSTGMSFAEVKGEETYQPAEQVTFTETWDQLDDEGQTVEPGWYELAAESTGCYESLQNCGPRASLSIAITAP